MKDTTGRPLLRPARILYHPYKFEGQWKVGRVLEKTVPKGMTASDVTLPGEFREFNVIRWEYEEHMSWARRIGLTSLLPDFKGMARSGFAGVKDYLFPIPKRNHSFVIESDSDLDDFDAPRLRAASNIQSLPGLPPAARIAEHGGASAARSHLPSSSQPSSSRHPQPAPADSGPSNSQVPANPVSAPRGSSPPVPPHSQPPSASLHPKSGSLKVRGQPFITTCHRSRAPYPLTHPPAAETLDLALSSGDLYVHSCTDPLAARPVQLWMLRGEEDGAGWVEVSEGHAHPELRDHRLHVRADGMLTWVTRKTATWYETRGRKRLLGGM